MKCAVGVHDLIFTASWDHAPWAYGDIRQYLKPKDYLSMSWKCRHCPKEVIHVRVPLKNEANLADQMVKEYRYKQRLLKEYHQGLREVEATLKECKQSVENTKGNQKCSI